jgi:hypothetical protein
MKNGLITDILNPWPKKSRSDLINTRSGVEAGETSKIMQNAGKERNWERPIFGPATSLFVGPRALRPCSLLTPRGRPKSLAAPSALIYEMTSC